MNYINQLQRDLARREAEIATMREQVQGFKIHLASQKFVGLETDGSRKDWIATSDISAFLETL